MSETSGFHTFVCFWSFLLTKLSLDVTTHAKKMFWEFLQGGSVICRRTTLNFSHRNPPPLPFSQEMVSKCVCSEMNEKKLIHDEEIFLSFLFLIIVIFLNYQKHKLK